MEKRFLLKVGTIAFFSVIGLNLQHAWADYGLTKQPLYIEVMAQSNDSGGGGDGTTGTLWKKTDSSCSITVQGAANAEATILGKKVKFDAKGQGSLTVGDAATSCESGGTFQCKSMTCGEFWIANGFGTSK